MFSDPKFDLQVSLTLLVLSLFVALVVWLVTKKKLLAGTVFSVLGNLSFLISLGSRLFRFYHIIWFKYFILFLWLPLNVYLIVKYIKSKKNEKE